MHRCAHVHQMCICAYDIPEVKDQELGKDFVYQLRKRCWDKHILISLGLIA